MASAPPDTATLLGRAIGPGYEVGAMLGRGGFGEVYAAMDRSLNRTVAIKVLRADVAESKAAVDRFRREAGALARLRHPHIMPVFGIGEGAGLTYFVMPKIDGESLAQLMERGERLPLVDACRVVAEAADALAAAHRAGVIHRDIKPDNILLEGVERHALLMDFGIAKSGGGDARLTGTGMIVGTPHYMSPEQATGDHTGPASDIYSFGVVAYELLAGRALFAQATSPQHAITAHLTSAPDDLRAVNPDVPAAIARAVMKCLRKDPAERWASVEEFLAAFNQARADLPRDPEIAIPEAAPSLSARTRGIATALAVAGAALAMLIYQRVAIQRMDAPRLSQGAALLVAERVADSLRVPRYRDMAWQHATEDNIIRFIRRGHGEQPDSMTIRRVPLGGWVFAFYTPGTTGYARLRIGADGWVHFFIRQIDTTAARPAAPLPVDAARLHAMLRTLGWNPDSLKLTDSTLTTADRREKRTYTWAPLVASTALTAAVDTATLAVDITLTDGQLTRYFTHVRLPAAELKAEARRSTVRVVTFVSLTIVVLIGCAIDLIRTQRARALRFERALRVGVLSAMLFCGSLIVITRPNGPLSDNFHPESSQFLSALGQVALMVLLIAPLLFLASTGLAAACEALALRKDPSVLAGYHLLTNRLNVARGAVPLPMGVAFGLAIGGIGALGAAITGWAGGGRLVVGAAWTQTFVESLGELGVILAFAPVAVLLVTWLLLHVRVAGQRLSDVMGAVMVAAVAVAIAFVLGQALPDAATFVMVAAGLAFMVGRRGVMETMIAFVAAVLVIQAAEAWRAPFSSPWPPTIALGLLVAAALAAAAFPTHHAPRTAYGSTGSGAPPAPT